MSDVQNIAINVEAGFINDARDRFALVITIAGLTAEQVERLDPTIRKDTMDIVRKAVAEPGNPIVSETPLPPGGNA